MSVTVRFVPHTHWDREWYHSAARFRLRLARLIDELLDLLARRPDFPVFLLDGQAIVAEDYLAVRPDREPDLRRLLAEGRLELGPWYVLADQFLVSAEALVRNLLEGSRTVRRYGGRPMAVGYAPDTFGHSAALPLILRGFGIEVAVVWRGFGGERGQEGDLYRWRAPDGSEVLMVHLPPPGYEYGASLPAESGALAARWDALKAMLAERARSPYWLVMNGADHHGPQPDLPEAIEALRRLEPETRFRITTLEEYADAVRPWAEAGTALPRVAGELRGGHRHAWTLQGTHGSRLYLKQENAGCQRLLERCAEPLVALAALRAGGSHGRTAGPEEQPSTGRTVGVAIEGLKADLRAAWRTLLENHSHDSICGTSADEVHREMMTRFARCRSEGDEIVRRGLEIVVGHDPVAAREAGREAWRPALLVFNPSPWRRDGIVEAEVAGYRADVRVGAAWEGRGKMRPGGKTRQTRDAASFVLIGPDGSPVPFQGLGSREGHDLVESPRHYPDCDEVEWRRVAIAMRDLPPLGVTALSVRPSVGPSVLRPSAPTHRRTDAPIGVRVGSGQLENDHVLVRVDGQGSLVVLDKASGEAYRGLAALEDNRDVGDSYTYSAPRGDRVVCEPDEVAVSVVHEGPLRGAVEIVRRYAATDLVATTLVTLDAGSPLVTIEVSGENRRTDHRVRAAFPLGGRARREVADGHFGPVERTGTRVRPRPGQLERPAPTAPMQRYVTAAAGSRGLTVYADGLVEYELRADGTVLMTLLRAFGELSRADLAERPGHAGWPTPTPDAQCLGPFRVRLGVLVHGESALEDFTIIERGAEAFHAPPLAHMLRSALRVPEPVVGPELVGEGLVLSAFKPAGDERGVVLRCYNALARSVNAEVRLPAAVGSVRLLRLDESAHPSGSELGRLSAGFKAKARGVLTLHLR